MTISNDLRSACLYSTVKNTSGGTKKFGFLPPHGRELTTNQEFTLTGHIVAAISRGEPVTDRRHQQALQTSLTDGDLEVVETPCVVVYDETNDNSKMLQLDNGAIAWVDAVWDPDSASYPLGP